MLPVSWQMGCDFRLASRMFWSMIFSALSAIVPFFSCSSDARMDWLTSSGISAEVRRINSSRESCNSLMKICGQRTALECQRQLVGRGGSVEVFDLHGHPKAKRAYAWRHLNEKNDECTRFVAELEIPPAVSRSVFKSLRT